MAKYDSQLTTLKESLSVATNILIVLPTNCGVDCLASGLALYLAFKNAGKSVTISSESTVRVSHTNLYGVGSIQNNVAGGGTGTWVLKIGGAVGTDGKPIFQKVDYNLKGSDLEMKFPIVPGQRFEPTHITPSFEGGSFELIFVVGAANLESLGAIYSQNSEVFTKAEVVNVDNSQANNQFGNTKIVDPQAATLSEMISQVIVGLGLGVDQDIATNLLTGIYEATGNLQGQTSAETFEVVAAALRSGGRKPVGQSSGQLQSSTTQQAEVVASSPTDDNSPSFDLSQIYAPSTTGSSDNFITPPVIDSSDAQSPTTHEREPGTETTYSGAEAEEIVEPQEDWLTPKVYSGKGMG